MWVAGWGEETDAPFPLGTLLVILSGLSESLWRWVWFYQETFSAKRERERRQGSLIFPPLCLKCWVAHYWSHTELWRKIEIWGLWRRGRQKFPGVCGDEPMALKQDAEVFSFRSPRCFRPVVCVFSSVGIALVIDGQCLMAKARALEPGL